MMTHRLKLFIGFVVACVFTQRDPSIAQTKPATRPTTAPATQPAKLHSANTPAPRTDEGWIKRNKMFNDQAGKSQTDLIFLGDSITQGWEGEGKEVWAQHYANRHAVNLGIGGDRTQHVLWRIQNGNLKGLDAHPPKLVVLMIGTNNSNGDDNSAQEIADGITTIIKTLREKLPQTKVLLLSIFPRGEKPDAQREKNTKASALAAKAADGKMVYALDIGSKFLNADGTLSKDIMPDYLHLSPKGYGIWADAIEAKVKELMGEATP